MVYKLDDPVVTFEPFQQFDLVGVTLICLVIGTIQCDPFESEDSPLCGAHDRVHFRRTAFSK